MNNYSRNYNKPNYNYIKKINRPRIKWITAAIPLEENGHVKRYGIERGEIYCYFFNNESSIPYFKERSYLKYNDIFDRYYSYFNS